MDVDNDSIDIQNSLADELQQRLLELPGRPEEAEKFTIFRVPDHIRQKNKQLYEPRMVSIGPYYHGNDAFQAMEKHKIRYLREYLSRNTGNSINHCISELRVLESRARRFYFEEVNLQSDEFLKMMLLDGCFIIEFLMKWNSGIPDEMFAVGWVLPTIRNDLLLLENQIPFFIVQKLFSLISSDPAPSEENNPRKTLVTMLLEYLSEGKKTEHPFIWVEIKHILHLYHFCYVPSLSANELSTKSFNIKEYLNPIKLLFVLLPFLRKLSFRRKQISTDERAGRRKPNSINERAPRTIQSATELQEAGITFKIKISENFLDIKFQNGILEIPFVSIEDTRRSRLLNLVYFEQCNANLRINLTSYACFMGSLFKTTRDVTLLHEMGIIDNLLATDQELVTFFTWLTECSYLDYEAHHLKDLFIDVNRYYNSDWHKWRARLKRDYFANPWLTISFIAACVLLVLAILQTVYTVLSFYKK
ncbi:hypothetical protein LUZ62_061194 [Rhynchospora pubera]|uniref:Uncharacterized protein n=1 Tax=Rhynchospora pubera TaxID=906938 RepID=A0AAV8EDV9_9POAL|nr:hypothetical protein LUZ62_061194 [Rhynchospora pubera]